MELALVLGEATGRRIGSIRQLAWQDFDFEAATILWRAETDKKRKEWVVPMPPALLEEVKRFRVKLGGAFGGLVFPAARDPTKPLGRKYSSTRARKHPNTQSYPSYRVAAGTR